MLYCHGNTGNRTSSYGAVYSMLRSKINVLTFDFSGYTSFFLSLFLGKNSKLTSPWRVKRVIFKFFILNFYSNSNYINPNFFEIDVDYQKEKPFHQDSMRTMTFQMCWIMHLKTFHSLMPIGLKFQKNLLLILLQQNWHLGKMYGGCFCHFIYCSHQLHFFTCLGFPFP